MTVSNPETSETATTTTGEKKRPLINKYKRGPRYNNSESLTPYPMPYIYYPPPSVYYPTTNTITRDDDDLEIIMHDDNTSSADLTRRSDQSKLSFLLYYKKIHYSYFYR